MYNIYLETYGCTSNQNNGEILSGLLSRAGLILTENVEQADIIILNTCIVKGPTLQRMMRRIQDFAEMKKKLIVAGCMVDVLLLAKRIKELAPKASLLGSHHFKEIVKVIRKIAEGEIVEIVDKKGECRLGLPKENQNRVVGITQISEGCGGVCSYCIVRHAKGKLFSYPQENILKNIENDLNAGCKEIWLTSQDNASYGLDWGKRKLPQLLKNVLKLKGKFLIRLGMVNPDNVKSILKDLLEIYKNNKMFKFLHIPIQSGSNKVLKSMKRGYALKEFINIVDTFRKEFPDMVLSTDVICGYPNETENDFNETMNIIHKIKPDILNISKYWPMPTTPASRMTQLPIEVVKKRAIQLMKDHTSIALDCNKKFLNRETTCLIDKKGFGSTWLGRDENYKLIVVRNADNLLGKFIKVKIKEAKPHYLLGELIKIRN